MRLAARDDRRSVARPEPRAQARLGQHVNRRQPGYPAIPGLCQARRRGRAHDAAPGGGQRVECAGRRVDGRERHHPPRCDPPADHLRTRRAGGGEADTAGSQEHQAQGSEGLEDRRQAREAARYLGKAQRQQGLFDRSAAAGDAQRRDQGRARVRQQDQQRRRFEDRQDARCPQGGASEGHRHCRGGRHLVAGEERARCADGHLGRGRKRQGVERKHREARRNRADGNRDQR